MAVRIERAGRGWRLHSEVRLPRPVDEVFPFFAEAHNLNLITPERVRFQILTPGKIEMAVGTLIDYRIRIRGVPVRWRTRISEWDPPRGFTDEQIRGPYLWWVHRHRFLPDGNETIATDVVDYGVPGGALVHAAMVGRDVRHIFEFRERRMLEIFGGEGGPAAGSAVEPAVAAGG